MRVSVKIIGLDRTHVSPAYFRLPTEFEAELVKEDVDNITVQYGKGAYCFKQNEVMYMVHDELA